MNENKNLKEFKIPVQWEVYGYVEVEAETAEEALKKALEIEHEGDGFALPTDSEYIDGSFEINADMDLIKAMNDDID